MFIPLLSIQNDVLPTWLDSIDAVVPGIVQQNNSTYTHTNDEKELFARV